MKRIKYQYLTRSGGYYWWVSRQDHAQGVCSVKVTEFWPEEQVLDTDLIAEQARLLRSVVNKIKEADREA